MCVLYSCRALPSIQILGQTLRCTFCPNVGHDSCHAAGRQLLLLLCAACAHPLDKARTTWNTLACIKHDQLTPCPRCSDDLPPKRSRQQWPGCCGPATACPPQKTGKVKVLCLVMVRSSWPTKLIHPYSVTGEYLIAKVPWRGSNRISSRPKKWQSTDQCIQRRSCCPKVPHNLISHMIGNWWPWWVAHASRKFWRKHEEMNGNDVNTHNQFPSSLDERCAQVSLDLSLEQRLSGATPLHLSN